MIEIKNVNKKIPRIEMTDSLLSVYKINWDVAFVIKRRQLWHS